MMKLPGVSAKVALMIVQCANAQVYVVRNDVGLMFLEFHTELLTFGTTLKTLMKKRGWLRVTGSVIGEKNIK